jgi:predicted nucleotidyltransferase
VRLGHQVNAGKDASQHLGRSLRLLRRKLRNHFGDKLQIAFPFGSYARGTMLSRAADPERDIDVLVVFADSGFAPDTYVERLRPFTKGAYARSESGRDSPAFSLHMSHIRFELVPALRRGIGHYVIPDTVPGRRNWISTYPERFAAELETASQQLPVLRLVIRLLKYWNVTAGRPFGSFELERQLVSAGLSRWPEGTNVPLTRSFAAAVEALSLPWDARPPARSALGRLKQAIREAVYLEFIGRQGEARDALEVLLPPLRPPRKRVL